jgi:DNA-binding MarR family transcriptional regulator
VNVATVNGIRDLGHSQMQPSFPGLLGNLDSEGTRIGALARRMGTTRQAVSQLAKEIEAAGLVERTPDPADRRGVVIRFTPLGRKVLADAVGVMTGLERDYTAILGERGLARLKRLLKQLLDEIDPAGALGLD